MPPVETVGLTIACYMKSLELRFLITSCIHLYRSIPLPEDW